MRLRLLIVQLFALPTLCGVAYAGQQCTFISDGNGGGHMSCNDPDADFARDMQLIQQLQQMNAEHQRQQQQAQQPVASVSETPAPQPAVTNEQVDAYLACSKIANESPDAVRMRQIFATENGYRVSAPLKNRYASKADAETVSRVVGAETSCQIPAGPDARTPMIEILLRFSAHLATYGETADAMRAQVEKLVHGSAQMLAQPQHPRQ